MAEVAYETTSEEAQEIAADVESGVGGRQELNSGIGQFRDEIVAVDMVSAKDHTSRQTDLLQHGEPRFLAVLDLNKSSSIHDQ